MQPFIKAILAGLFVTILYIYFVTDFNSGSVAENQAEISQKKPAGSMPLFSGPVSYSTAVKAASPAVVNINTEKVVTVRNHPFFQ